MNHNRLIDLLNDLPVPWQTSNPLPDLSVQSIQYDSRRVSKGDVFVAISGGNTDSHEFIPDAVQKGAVAVVGTRSGLILPVPYIRVEDSREALAYLAAAFYDHPARKMTVIGVTGTDGKTTTANLVYEILNATGRKVGLVSTVNAVIGSEVIDTGFHVTTPEATDVQHYLAEMVTAGMTHVVLETTSHGLAQSRVSGCEYDVAVITNITHEHLDYHGSYEEYRAAKARMFTGLAQTAEKPFGNPRLAVLNRDDISYPYLSSLVSTNQVSYALEGEADLTAMEIKTASKGVDFVVKEMEQTAHVHCNIPGRYNVSNCLAAIAAARGLGVSLQEAASGVSRLRGVPGRMESIDFGQPFTAIVDFAHTPNALKVALETAREMTKRRIIAVFGSAGLRDREKRKMMAEVSTALADITILTAEDPRTESLEAILEEMASAARASGGSEGSTFFRIPDRGEAIRQAVNLAQPGDLVITCGKGHEQSMCFGTVEYPWDDRIALKAALAERLNLTGYQMPWLPPSNS